MAPTATQYRYRLASATRIQPLLFCDHPNCQSNSVLLKIWMYLFKLVPLTLFAVTFATKLALYVLGPATRGVPVQPMQDETPSQECLEEEKMEMFSFTPKKRLKNTVVKATHEVFVYQKIGEYNVMMECTTCKKWFTVHAQMHLQLSLALGLLVLQIKNARDLLLFVVHSAHG